MTLPTTTGGLHDLPVWDFTTPSVDDARQAHTGAMEILKNAVLTDDARLPSTPQKAALTGTAGTPSDTNRFVTSQDLAAEAAARVAAAAAEASARAAADTTAADGLTALLAVPRVFYEDFGDIGGTPAFEILFTRGVADDQQGHTGDRTAAGAFHFDPANFALSGKTLQMALQVGGQCVGLGGAPNRDVVYRLRRITAFGANRSISTSDEVAYVTLPFSGSPALTSKRATSAWFAAPAAGAFCFTLQYSGAPSGAFNPSSHARLLLRHV